MAAAESSGAAAAASANMAGGAAAGGLIAWLVGGGFAVAAFLAALVAMCARWPRDPREWVVGIVSTAVLSVAGGAAAAVKLGLLRGIGQMGDTEAMLAMAQVIGLAFACGLPAWALVRAAFTWLAKREGKDIGELARDGVQDARSVLGPKQ
ncbi:MAG: hypothetical protein KIH64_014820 [Mycobacterium sp.]|nr:hypothetical protein [Mycobacterium sp.]